MPRTKTAFSRSEIEAKCMAIIDRHEHRAVLNEGDLRYWVRETVGLHGEAACWHATRAGGFGGSEIGVLVRQHQGFPGDHQVTAHDIVEGKLLRRIPDGDNGNLRRGHDNEARHAEWFRAKYDAVRDVEAFEKLSKATGLRSWMRYSPDELALLPSETPNPHLGGQYLVRILADYKAPSKVEADDVIAYQYACQLIQGAMICYRQGIHLDGLMLSQFDWAGWQLKDDHVPYDPEIAQQILVAGDHYWNDYVLQGRVPRYILKGRLQNEAELQRELAEKGTRLAQMKALAKALETAIEAEEEPLKNLLAQHRISGLSLPLGELTVTAVAKVDHGKVKEAVADVAVKSAEFDAEGVALGPEAAQMRAEELFTQSAKALAKGTSVDYDADAMARYLREQNVPLRQFAKFKASESVFYNWALEHGLNPEHFIKEEPRMTPSKHLKEEALRMVEGLFRQPQPEAEGESAAQRPAAGTDAPVTATVLVQDGIPSQFTHLAPAAGDEPTPQEHQDDRNGLVSERFAQRP